MLHDLIVAGGGGAALVLVVVGAVWLLFKDAGLKLLDSHLEKRQAEREFALDRKAKRLDQFDGEVFSSALVVWEALRKLERAASTLWREATTQNLESCEHALRAARTAVDHHSALIVDAERADLDRALYSIEIFIDGKSGLLGMLERHASQRGSTSRSRAIADESTKPSESYEAPGAGCRHKSNPRHRTHRQQSIRRRSDLRPGVARRGAGRAAPRGHGRVEVFLLMASVTMPTFSTPAPLAASITLTMSP